MPEDVGGQPLQGGGEPEDRDQGAADGGTAPVVFDESFVRAARVHEPTAAERARAAARFRAEAEAARAYEEQYGHEWDPEEADGGGTGPDEDGARRDAPEYVAGYWEGPYEDEHAGPPERGALAEEDGPAYGYGRPPRPYRGHFRWQRPIAWLLVLVMGVGVVALAFAAVHRGAASDRRQTPAPPPATSGAGTAGVVEAGAAAGAPSGAPAAAPSLVGLPVPSYRSTAQ